MAKVRFSHLDDFVLKDDGNVGIQTSLPSAKVEVAGTVRAANIKSSSGITTVVSLDGYANQDMEYSDSITIDSGDSGTLSGEIVIGAGLTMTVGTGVTSGQGRINSLKVSNTFNPPIGSSDERPSAPKPGALFYNKDFRTIEYWDGSFWRQVDNTTSSTRANVAGGYGPSAPEKIIDAFNISTTGNAVDWGELISNTRNNGVAGNAIRGISHGGWTPSYYTKMEYWSLASGGRAVEFGSMGPSSPSGRSSYNGGVASSTRAVFMGCYAPGGVNNTIDYGEIMTTGNSIDFGDVVDKRWNNSSCSSPTRAVQFGGFSPTAVPYIQTDGSVGMRSTIDYITMASTGDTKVFGDLIEKIHSAQAGGNATRGICSGGYQGRDTNIQYVTMASTGNAQYFGDLISTIGIGCGTASGTRMVTIGGWITPALVNNIEYVNIASAGNAVDFGELSSPRHKMDATSDCHGGLGGF